MENRIKEQQLCLFAHCTSCSQMRANQLRLCFFLVRICADAGLTVAGIERYAVRQRTMLDAASETFENRCAGGCQRAPGVVFMVRKLSMAASILTNCGQSQTSAGTRTTCITPASPSMTIMADGLDRSLVRGAAVRCGRSWIWGLNRVNGAH